MLQISNLSSGYGDKSGYTEVLKNFDLLLEDGEIAGIVGESGSGKTTLLRTIMGELYRSDGDILHNGRSIFSRELYSEFKSKRILVRQDSLNILKPKYSVEFQLKKLYKGGKYLREDVDWAFMHLNLSQDVLEKLPAQLSDGTRHRVVLAMAAIMKPEILLLDEPTTGLDSSSILGFLNLLRDLSKSTSIIFVSSDVVPVFQVCHRIYVMKNGMLLEDGNWENLINRPYHPYTMDLVRYVPSMENRNLKYNPTDNGEDSECVFFRNCDHISDQCRTIIPYKKNGDHGYRCIRYPEWTHD